MTAKDQMQRIISDTGISAFRKKKKTDTHHDPPYGDV